MLFELGKEVQKLGSCYIGVSGWAYKDWKGIVYDKSSEINPIRYLAQWINSIEVNVTFYKPVSSDVVWRWVYQVDDIPDFLFTVKLWSRFTHNGDIEIDFTEMGLFIDSIEPLVVSKRLGCILIQFPHRFHRTIANRRYLARLIDLLSPLPIAVEFRHRSWLHPGVIGSFSEMNIGFCNIDQPIVDWSCLPPTDIVTTDFAYVRLHGRNKGSWFSGDSNRDERYNYLYSEEELEPWLEKVSSMRKRADKVFVMLNNHYMGKALINAYYLRRKIEGIDLPPLPPSLLNIYMGGSELF